jgi:hypothetical protein
MKFCNNNNIIDYNWKLFFEKIKELNITNIKYKLYIDDLLGPYILEDETNKKSFFNSNQLINLENNTNLEIFSFTILKLSSNNHNFQNKNINYYLLFAFNNYNFLYSDELLSKINFLSLDNYYLIEAINKNDKILVKYLLNKGFNSNKEYLNESPLFIAITNSIFINKDLEIIKLLLEYGAKPNVSLTMLELIIEKNRDLYDLFKILLDNGLNIIDSHFKYKLLIKAIESDNVNFVKLLLNKGFNPNYEDLNLNEESPLFIAIGKVMMTINLEIVKLLLEYDAKPNIPYVLLELIIRLDLFDLFKILLDYGLNYNIINFINDTLLITAVKLDKLNFVELLLNKGINPNKKNTFKENAIMISILKENIPILDFLINNCVDIKINYEDKIITLLEYAYKKNKFNVAKYLFESLLYTKSESDIELYENKIKPTF